MFSQMIGFEQFQGFGDLVMYFVNFEVYIYGVEGDILVDIGVKELVVRVLQYKLDGLMVFMKLSVFVVDNDVVFFDVIFGGFEGIGQVVYEGCFIGFISFQDCYVNFGVKGDINVGQYYRMVWVGGVQVFG